MRFLNTARKLWASNSYVAKVAAGLAVLCVALAHTDCIRERSLGIEKFVSPQYPLLARVHHVTGSVDVRVEIGPEGRVVNAKGSGRSPVLVETAEQNARQWQFKVPKAGPFPLTRTIIYDFRLVGTPSLVGLTTAEFVPPNHLRVIDQPASEKVPEPIPPGGIAEPTGYEPRLLERLRDCYSKHCGSQATGPIDQVPLRELIDCYSKHCQQDLQVTK